MKEINDILALLKLLVQSRVYGRTRSEAMISDIRQLLNDKDKLAQLMAHTKLMNLSLGFYEVKDGIQISCAITADKKQLSSREAAFAALFKRLLFEDYEWEIDTEPLTSDERWVELFKDMWIDEYFSETEKLPFTPADSALVIDYMTYDLTEGNEPDAKAIAFLKDANNVAAILVKTGYISRLFFGETDCYYFLYDYDLYD